MKLKFRIIALILSIFSIFSLLVACDSSGSSEETTAGDNQEVTEDQTTEVAPNIEKKNYDCDFNILYCDGIYDPNNYFPEESLEGAVLQDAAVERNASVSEYLGVDFYLINAPDINLVNNLRASMQSGDDSYQMVMTHPYIYVDAMITEGMLLDLSEQPAINTDAPYWNGQLMEQLSIKDKMFLGYSDYSLANTWLITFNKEIHKTYQMEDLYALVDNKGWTTYEELIDYYAIGQCTPGVIAVNVATFVGYKTKGIIGGIVATLGMVTPSLIIVGIIAAFLHGFQDYEAVQWAFSGIRAAVVALIISAIWIIAKKSLVDIFAIRIVIFF